MFIRKREAGARRGLRWLNWGVVAACALAIPAGVANPELGMAAAACGIVAAIAGGFAYERIAASAPALTS
jgi:hypothetical protein